MLFLPTSRASILAFLLVSFFLFLLLSPFHHKHPAPYSNQLPLHYLTLRSQQTLPASFFSAHPRPPIYVLRNENRLLCRLYHACRLQNNHILLPSPIKPYSRFLRTYCGLTNPLVFSSRRSLKKLNYSFTHDWLAPNTPYHHLRHYTRHYLPSFYSPAHPMLHPFRNFEKNYINASCLLPFANPTRPLLSHCPNPPELTVPYPAVILDHHHIHHPNYQRRTQQLVKTYQTTFRQQLRIIDSKSLQSSSDAICFRSIISSPPETFSEDSNVKFSTNTNVANRSELEAPSMFETLFKRIAGRLARAFYDESSTPRRGTSFGKQSDLGTIDWSDASYFKSGDSNRILRKLLTGKFKRDKRERKKRIASENSAKSTAGMDIMQASGDKGAKTKTAITEHFLTNSTLPKGTANMNVLNANNNKYNSKNQAISRGNADRTANSVDKNHVPKDSGRNSWQAETVSPATGFDDVDLEDETNDDDYLPTFEYLLNYDPDLN